MLTDTDLRRIAEQGYLYDHCWRFTSLMAGEPWLVNDSLIHYDGRHLYVLDFPLSEGTPGLAPVLDEWVRRLEPSLVWYSGRAAIPNGTISSLKPIHLYEPDPSDVCMEIHLPTFRLESQPKLASWIRAGEKKSYTVQENSPGLLGYRHIQLIESFVRKTSPGPIARAFLGCLGHFVRLEQARLIEVWQRDQLVAFGVVESWFRNMDVFLYGFAKEGASGAFDTLQHALIRSAQARGKATLNVGYSINAGIKRFKEKWGATAIGNGYYDQLWHAYEGFDVSHVYWPARLL